MDWIVGLTISIWFAACAASIYVIKRTINQIKEDHERIVEFRTAALLNDVRKLRQRNERLENEKLFGTARLKAAEETLAAAQKNASAEVELLEEAFAPPKTRSRSRNAKKTCKSRR